LLDEEMKSYASDGLLCQDYHCFNKPVLAPADGIVEEIIDHLDDNEIGHSDTVNNWGNTITIRHLPGLYTQLSHLRKGSIRITKGEAVKRGDVLAACGNSGRSPQPHLHFQVQASPRPGSKTIDYPFAYYMKRDSGNTKLFSFSNPGEGEIISDVQSHILLRKSFDLRPNTVLDFCYRNENNLECKEQWIAYTDAYNYNYLYCSATESSAYYVNDGSVFYFTSFYGNKKSLLYYFYLSAFKVLLGYYKGLELKDVLPLNTIRSKNGMIWIHDFIAPFTSRIRANYSIIPAACDDDIHPQTLTLESSVDLSIFGKTRHESSGTIVLSENRIEKFTYRNNKINIEATCINL